MSVTPCPKTYRRVQPPLALPMDATQSPAVVPAHRLPHSCRLIVWALTYLVSYAACIALTVATATHPGLKARSFTFLIISAAISALILGVVDPYFRNKAAQL